MMIGELDAVLLLIHANPLSTGRYIFKGSLSRWLPQFAFCNLATAIVENATVQHLQSRGTASPLCSSCIARDGIYAADADGLNISLAAGPSVVTIAMHLACNQPPSPAKQPHPLISCIALVLICGVYSLQAGF